MAFRWTMLAGLILIGCAGGAQTVIDKPPRAVAQAPESAWTHTMAVTNPGTKSEGLREDLAYGGRPIPPAIDRLVALGYEWKYRPFTYAWTPWGWHIAGPAPALGIMGAPLTSEEEAAGMAASSGLEMRPGIPGTWVLAIRGDEYWWSAPEKLSALAAARGWEASR